ncbi:electron transport complex subunit RsxC [Blastopirellula sp. JC732]|uniref:Ion-translocating oxidoreductase complex subunit C n=1 Tax=Blastopirellula sediminis TaxID=2894196 RepID=A0A9X1SF12_9BACT|nr:electron transport complex subunit RsxC [Blastopirellula sediminis]MCC9609415.1 electron transport complex subunit RsxC [Blastopirellula sediminis]MCC9627808.1 electron transport complex subunit RsxC [Blastopirellula sediminis]
MSQLSWPISTFFRGAELEETGHGFVESLVAWAKSSLGGKGFAHGIHPPENKDDTRDLAIEPFPLPELLTIPLAQHIGKPSKPVVGKGDKVTRGQLIAEPDGFMSVAIHAPVSGVIRKIAPAPNIKGKMEPAFFLQPDEDASQEMPAQERFDYQTATPAEIIAAIQQAGIVGLGGAAFPTHAKIKVPEGKSADTLLINGAECEPYLTTDHRVMLEHADDVMTGIEYLLKACGAKQAIIAVEANKEDAAETLRAAIRPGRPVTVEVLPVKYPQGAEKMLAKSVLGREVPAGGLPIDVGIVCVNVGTTANVGRLLPHRLGLYERVVTVGGPGVKRKGNFRIAIGTTLRFILETVGTEEDISTVVMGGPMMGNAASSLDIPITKGSTGVIAMTQQQTGVMIDRKEYPCITCGACVDACPMFLNPSQLGLLSKNGRFDTMASDYHLMACFECGCCSYVCPSKIPLVERFRVAKAAIRSGGGKR